MTELRPEPLSVDEVRAAVVRDHDQGRGVTALTYRAHPSAAAELGKVAEKVAASHPILALAVAHRTGELQIGDLAVVAAVAAEHRDVAFAACQQLIDDLKATVPIWKNQFFAGGDSEWVNSA